MLSLFLIKYKVLLLVCLGLCIVVLFLFYISLSLLFSVSCFSHSIPTWWFLLLHNSHLSFLVALLFALASLLCLIHLPGLTRGQGEGSIGQVHLGACSWRSSHVSELILVFISLTTFFPTGVCHHESSTNQLHAHILVWLLSQHSHRCFSVFIYWVSAQFLHSNYICRLWYLTYTYSRLKHFAQLAATFSFEFNFQFL